MTALAVVLVVLIVAASFVDLGLGALVTLVSDTAAAVRRWVTR